LTVAVAVHPAAPLGKTGPEEVFRKKVRADRDRRRRRTPITVTSIMFPVASSLGEGPKE
jgi:hypothetical protein